MSAEPSVHSLTLAAIRLRAVRMRPDLWRALFARRMVVEDGVATMTIDRSGRVVANGAFIESLPVEQAAELLLRELEQYRAAGCEPDAALDDGDLPDPEALLQDPTSLRLPERGDRAYTILTGVVAAVVAHNTVERWNAGWAVLVHAGRTSPDIAACAARGLCHNKPTKGVPMPAALDDVFIPLLRRAGLL